MAFCPPDSPCSGILSDAPFLPTPGLCLSRFSRLALLTPGPGLLSTAAVFWKVSRLPVSAGRIWGSLCFALTLLALDAPGPLLWRSLLHQWPHCWLLAPPHLSPLRVCRCRGRNLMQISSGKMSVCSFHVRKARGMTSCSKAAQTQNPLPAPSPGSAFLLFYSSWGQEGVLSLSGDTDGHQAGRLPSLGQSHPCGERETLGQ